MHDHVKENSPSMFRDSVNYVKEQLLAMVQTQEQNSEKHIREALVTIRHDYLAALGCTEVPETQALSTSQKIVPEDITRIINMIVPIFQALDHSTLEKGNRDSKTTFDAGAKIDPEERNAIVPEITTTIPKDESEKPCKMLVLK
ncbi:MAG: hypothetical protein Q9182_004013 [Xanthomendoza sp. 2 TL-2023]